MVKDYEFDHIQIEHLVQPFPLYSHTYIYKPNLASEWVEVSAVDSNENMLW